jgi:hypothetical protein
MIVLWAVTACSLVDSEQRFGRTRFPICTQKRDAVCTSKTFVPNNQHRITTVNITVVRKVDVCRISGGQIRSGARFLRVVRFPLSTLIP